MSGGMIIFLEIIAPLVALILYARIKKAKAKRKLAALDDTPAVTIKPFAPKPEPTPSALSRRFSAPQRAYLRQQIALAKGCFYIVGWVSLVLFTAGLLPQYVNAYGLEQPLAQRVWYSYLNHATVSEIWFAIVALMGAGIAVAALTSGASAVFNRTRPLAWSFLFWARVLPAIATVLAAIAAGVILSCLLLLIFYGPVWLHLMDTARPHNGGLVVLGLRHQQGSRLVHLLQTSAPRIFLSITTSAILLFSGFVVILSQPFSFLGKGTSVSKSMPIAMAMVGSVFGVQLLHIVHGDTVSRFYRPFFLYPSLGPPPPYVYVLVPLAASVLLLYLAQFLAARKEL